MSSRLIWTCFDTFKKTTPNRGVYRLLMRFFAQIKIKALWQFLVPRVIFPKIILSLDKNTICVIIKTSFKQFRLKQNKRSKKMNLQKLLIEKMEKIHSETKLERETRLMREELAQNGQTEKFWKHFEFVNAQRNK